MVGDISLSVKEQTLDIPLIEASARGSKQKPTLIVFSPTFTTSEQGAALGIANRMHGTSSGESCHYVVDSSVTYRCLPDRLASVRPSGMTGSIDIRLCDDPGSPARWQDQAHSFLLARLSFLTARLCASYRIPDVFLTHDELRSWMRCPRRSRGGIYLTRGLGDFPRQEFMKQVALRIP